MLQCLQASFIQSSLFFTYPFCRNSDELGGIFICVLAYSVIQGCTALFSLDYVLWVVTPCKPVGGYERVGRIDYYHLA